MNNFLSQDLIPYLKSIGKQLDTRHIWAFQRLGLLTIEDILRYAPARYINYDMAGEVEDVADKQNTTITGFIEKINIRKSWKSKINMCEAQIIYNDKKIKLFWFNQPYIGNMYKEGQSVLLSGKIEIKESKTGVQSYIMSNPHIEEIREMPSAANLFTNGTGTSIESNIIPVYNECKFMTSKYLSVCIKKILSDKRISMIIDPLPATHRDEMKLPNLINTIKMLHFPKSDNDWRAARKRLLFEEIFYLQLNIEKEKGLRQDNLSYKISINDKVLKDFFKKENITPTGAQNKVIREILNDLSSGKNMSRLLEGDVGSGKTLVAVAAMIATINNKRDDNKIGTPLQVVYLAPTDILAKQQFENCIHFFQNHNIEIGYLSSKESLKYPSKILEGGKQVPTKISKPQLLKWIAGGNISILVGTHSVTKKSVEFKDLALIIIDEQHRFGVKTRADIAHKRSDTRLEIPHLLSMSATPIPRSLALTIFGDLDLSIIDEMPLGRRPIITRLCRQTDYDEVYNNIRNEINNGRQVYVICNKINDDEDGKKSVESELKKLKTVFPEYNISSVNGKTEKGLRDNIMSDFKNNKINILISTTVIEVGVNVPNATVMLIENAEKFGLAQLHQIRGRVGRGEHQSYCYIFSENHNDVTVNRLNNFVKSNNGFELADIDLKERGPGALVSYRQSGLTDIAMEGIQNIKLVEHCKRLAKIIIAEDIELKNYPLLQEKVKLLSEMHLE